MSEPEDQNIASFREALQADVQKAKADSDRLARRDSMLIDKITQFVKSLIIEGNKIRDCILSYRKDIRYNTLTQVSNIDFSIMQKIDGQWQKISMINIMFKSDIAHIDSFSVTNRDISGIYNIISEKMLAIYSPKVDVAMVHIDDQENQTMN